MKKLVVLSLSVFCTGLVLIGCSKEKEIPTIANASVNTLLVLEDGTAKSALVDEFDKPYYNTNELKEFINKDIAIYGKSAGADAVSLEDIGTSSESVIAKFSYKSIMNYSEYMKADTEVMSNVVATQNINVPESLINVEDGANVSKEEALSDEDYKVLVTNSPGYNIMVDGDILYYSNGLLLDESTVQSGSEGYTVIVYE